MPAEVRSSEREVQAAAAKVPRAEQLRADVRGARAGQAVDVAGGELRETLDRELESRCRPGPPQVVANPDDDVAERGARGTVEVDLALTGPHVGSELVSRHAEAPGLPQREGVVKALDRRIEEAAANLDHRDHHLDLEPVTDAPARGDRPAGVLAVEIEESVAGVVRLDGLELREAEA